jgi:hypothetical protein
MNGNPGIEEWLETPKATKNEAPKRPIQDALASNSEPSVKGL